MSIYIVLVLLVLPAPTGQPAPMLELQRTHITASSAAACQAHADQLAQRQRQLNATTVQRLQARVVGTCTPTGPQP